MALAALAFTAAVAAAVSPLQFQALHDLYSSTNGPNWKKNAGWTGNASTVCAWDGVGCDETGTVVVGLSLPENGLVGSIPASFSNLVNLT